MRRDGINGFCRFGRFGLLLPLTSLARPNVEAAVTAERAHADLPLAPDAFALAKPAIENIVGADITLRPVTLADGRIVSAFYEELAEVIIAIATYGTVRKGKVEVHPVTVARMIIIEPCPRPGRKKVFAHAIGDW